MATHTAEVVAEAVLVALLSERQVVGSMHLREELE